MSVKAPAEKNFRRAKVKPSKRRASRTRSLWKIARGLVCAVLACYVAYRAFSLVATASVLQVRKIVVRGNVRLSAGEVGALVDGLRGTNILTANLAEYRHRLRDSPWVGDVAIRRLLPSTLEVFVSERTPIGLCRLGSQLYLVDRHGTVIDEFGPQYSEFDLPIVDGLVRSHSAGGPVIDAARAELAARVIDALAPHKELARQLSQIDVSDAHDAVVLLDRDGALLHVGEDRFVERIQGYVDIAPALRERVQDIEYVDLRFDERLYVRPTGRPPRAQGRAEAPPAAGRRF